ncbi:MAG: hypothetical protein RBT57_01930 [Paludibacter sp.]|jgi:hypothetical protein|nr:hypothetical protein [Paludibacter sp.]
MNTRNENIIAVSYAKSTETKALLRNKALSVFTPWFLNMPGEWHVGQSGTDKPIEFLITFTDRNEKLQWTDASGAVTPDGYLVRMSNTSYADIAAPTDGQSYTESSTDKHVSYGTQQVWYKNLGAGTYYFKIYPYKGTGTSIDYKTDGAPQTTKTIQ